MSGPKVTIATLVYNTGKFVVEALKAISEIDYPNIENIIIDDFSSDCFSTQMVEDWIKENNYPCIFIKHQENWGICKTLNQVVALSSGEYLIYCSDDILEVDSIQKMVAHFKSLPEEYGIVYGDISVIDSNSSVIEESYFRTKNQDPALPITFSTYLRSKRRFPTIGTMYRRKIFTAIGPYDENLIAEDVDIHLRILSKYSCSYCGSKVARYRRHDNQLSKKQSLWYVQDRLKIFVKWLGKCSEQDSEYLKNAIIYLLIRSYLNGDSNVKENIRIVKKYYMPLKIKLLILLVNLKIPVSLVKTYLFLVERLKLIFYTTRLKRYV